MSVLIRRMCLEDIPAVHEIDVLSFSLPWPEKSFHFELTSNSTSRGWVAELGGQVVGMLVLWLVVDEAHIATLATHPSHRQQGIGEKLLITALISAREEGASHAFLEVAAGNSAGLSLYRKYGFVVSGKRSGYYKDTHEDAILMDLNDLENLEMK